jgi:hypothetical protein
MTLDLASTLKIAFVAVLFFVYLQFRGAYFSALRLKRTKEDLADAKEELRLWNEYERRLNERNRK